MHLRLHRTARFHPVPRGQQPAVPVPALATDSPAPPPPRSPRAKQRAAAGSLHTPHPRTSPHFAGRCNLPQRSVARGTPPVALAQRVLCAAPARLRCAGTGFATLGVGLCCPTNSWWGESESRAGGCRWLISCQLHRKTHHAVVPFKAPAPAGTLAGPGAPRRCSAPRSAPRLRAGGAPRLHAGGASRLRAGGAPRLRAAGQTRERKAERRAGASALVC